MSATTMSPQTPSETPEAYMERQKLRDLVFGFLGLIDSLKPEANLSPVESIAVVAEEAINRITVEFPYELRQLNYYEAEQTIWRFRSQYSHHLLTEPGLLTAGELWEQTKQTAENLHDHYCIACGSESYDDGVVEMTEDDY